MKKTIILLLSSVICIQSCNKEEIQTNSIREKYTSFQYPKEIYIEDDLLIPAQSRGAAVLKGAILAKLKTINVYLPRNTHCVVESEFDNKKIKFEDIKLTSDEKGEEELKDSDIENAITENGISKLEVTISSKKDPLYEKETISVSFIKETSETLEAVAEKYDLTALNNASIGISDEISFMKTFIKSSKIQPTSFFKRDLIKALKNQVGKEYEDKIEEDNLEITIENHSPIEFYPKSGFIIKIFTQRDGFPLDKYPTIPLNNYPDVPFGIRVKVKAKFNNPYVKNSKYIIVNYTGLD